MIKICRHHGELTPDLIMIGKTKKNNPLLICKLCIRERSKKSYNKNKPKEKERKRLDYLKNREKYILYSREYRLKNPDKNKISRHFYGIKHKDKIKNQMLTSKFNINLDKYNEILKSQNDVCAICKKEEITKSRGNKIRNLSVDHCHKTNKIRGILCSNCNLGLGNFQDSIEALKLAIKYLKKHSIKQK